MQLARFLLKPDFIRKHTDGPRRRFGTLTKVCSSKEFLSVPTVCQAVLAYETTKLIKTWLLFPRTFQSNRGEESFTEITTIQSHC